MKNVLVLIFITTYLNLFSQIDDSVKISLDNNLTGMLGTSESTQFGLNFSGNNGVDFKRMGIDITTNYNIGYSNELTSSELVQKENITYNRSKSDLFFTHQFNYSYLRQIRSDNSFGVGFGLKKKLNSGKISLSYALIYQTVDYQSNTYSDVFRHSVRAKFVYENKLIGLSFEYYYQPSILKSNDYIIYGTTKMSIKTKSKITFIIQDVLNFRSMSSIKTINNLTFGVGYQLSKNYIKKPTN